MKGTTNVPEISVIIRKGNKILFVLREKTGYSDGMYALPGGHVEPGERFSASAIREAMEEVNVIISVDGLQPVFAMHRLGRTAEDVRVGMFFEATKWEGTPENREPERHGSLGWFDADDLPYEKIMAFQAEGLQAMQRGDIYMELGWDTGSAEGI